MPFDSRFWRWPICSKHAPRRPHKPGPEICRHAATDCVMDLLTIPSKPSMQTPRCSMISIRGVPIACCGFNGACHRCSNNTANLCDIDDCLLSACQNLSTSSATIENIARQKLGSSGSLKQIQTRQGWSARLATVFSAANVKLVTEPLPC